MIEKIGPYRVYERLGVGGMGEVYKAYDDRLDRWVAIKRIRPDREDAEDNRERFKREARATARLNHPSIVHLYGIFEEGGSDCIVMEYVDGKTLDQLLVEGPLDSLRVANLGHEIAAGLGEAHANGILHRDLKAENIMITPRGRAKILDFGLAKPILNAELDPVLTGKGQLVGTSRAMSPEYVSGEAVDHRSDLFSLGVLLYECVTGHSPFKAHNTLATLKQVMLHKQTPIKQLNPKVPTELSNLIDRLLEKDPKNRPQNAHEIALAFGRLTGQVSSGVVDIPGGLPTGDLTRTSSTLTNFSASDTVLDLRPRHRWMTLVAVVVVLVSGAFVLGKFFKGPGFEEPIVPLEDRIHIVIGDFQNNTDEETLGASLAEAFRVVIEQSRSNTVLSRNQIQDAIARMRRPEIQEVDRKVGIELLEREGAERLISGLVSKFGKSYSIVIDVLDPAGATVFSSSVTAKDADQLLSAIEKSALEIRAHLGESADEIHNSEPLARVSTPDLQALKAYTIGLQMSDEDDSEEAIRFFYRALELDGEFSMAHVKLGVLYSNSGQDEKAEEQFNLALKHSDRLSKVQEFYLNGWKARWDGSLENVVKNWSLMSSLYPEDYAAHFNHGVALRLFHNDCKAALASFEKAVDLSRGWPLRAALGQKAICQLGVGDVAGAGSTLAGGPVTEEMLNWLAVSRDYSEFDKLASPEVYVFEWRYQSLLVAASIDRGQFAAAEQVSRSAFEAAEIAEDPVQLFQAIADRGIVLYLMGDKKSFQDLADLALRTIGDKVFPRRAEQSPYSLMALLGILSTKNGDVGFARRFAEKLGDDPDRYGSKILLAEYNALLGGIAAFDKEFEAASKYFESSIATAELTAAVFARGEVRFLQGDYLGASLDFQKVVESRGAAFVQCESFCFGRNYFVLLNIVALARQGDVAFEQGLYEEASESYSEFLELWGRELGVSSLIPPEVQRISERVVKIQGS